MDDATRRRCTAMSKRSGERCKRAPAVGRTVCAMHGGKSPVGPASPHWVDGRFSRVLPARLLARYEEAYADAELLALRDEIALTDARINDVLGRVDTGESSRLWSALHRGYAALMAARHAGDRAGTDARLAELGDILTAGRGDWAAWADVLSLIRDRQRLVESERKRLVEAQHVIAVDQAMALLGLLVDAVRRHVRDDAALRAIAAEYARLTGLPDRGATDR